jgi:hypothetical protein
MGVCDVKQIRRERVDWIHLAQGKRLVREHGMNLLPYTEKGGRSSLTGWFYSRPAAANIYVSSDMQIPE